MKVVVLNWRDYLNRGNLYVNRMASMVDRHLRIPFEFVVVTEKDVPKGRSSWFNKLSLLEMFDDEVLYFDLDLIITADISRLVEVARTDSTKIWARDDWSYPVTNPRLGKEATINSSVMYWCGRKDMTGAEELIPKTHGDQGIITQLFWPNGIRLFPGDMIQSYKYGILQGEKPGPIICFHGLPKPHEVHDSWLRDHWR